MAIPAAGSTSPTSAWRPPNAARAAAARFWVERKPKETCPKCGGELLETEERRRATKGGFRTAKECAAAMNKVLTAVEERSYVAPSKITVREFLLREWLPAIRSTIRPSTYYSYVQHVTFHILPHIGSLQLVNLTPARINALYATLALTGKKDGKKGLSPRSVHHVHAVLHRACKDAVRWGRLTRNPRRCGRPTARWWRASRDEDLDRRHSSGPSCPSSLATASLRSGTLWP